VGEYDFAKGKLSAFSGYNTNGAIDTNGSVRLWLNRRVFCFVRREFGSASGLV